MASTKIRGITIELGADTSGLSKALKNVNSEIGSTQKQLKDVERLLKLDPTNVELLAQKQKLLKDAVSETSTKLKALKQAQEEVGKELENTGEGQEAYDALTREIIACENELKNLEKAAKASNVTLSKIKATADKVATSASNIGRKLAPVTAGLTALGVSAIGAASDLAEAQNKVEVAFGKSADYVKQFGETTLDQFGIARGTALDMAALFGDMATSMGLTQGEAAKMSTSLVGLAGDLASFKNIGLDQASNALKGIFTGESESLKSLGIVMTQTNLDAYALANGFNKTTKEMTEAEKVQLRYAYIMDKTKNAQGDFANTSDGTANSIRTFKEAVKELQEEIGENLLPAITPIIHDLTEMVKAFGNADDNTQKFVVNLGLVVAALSPVAFGISGIAKAISGVSGLFLKLGFGAETAATTTAAASSTIGGAVTGTLATVASVISGIILAVTGLTAFVSETGEKVKTTLNGIDMFLTTAVAHDWTESFGQMGVVINNFLLVVQKLWSAFKAEWESFINLCQSVWHGQWSSVWESFKNVFKKAWDSIATFAKAPLNAIIGMVNSAISGINSVISGFNRMSFKMPNWLGGQSWSPNLPTIPTIPMLAQGGIVTGGSAIVGEAGAELLSVSNGQARVSPLTNSASGHGDITSLLQTYLPYLATGDQIILDSGVLVGQIAPQMSNALGRIYNREQVRR